MESKTEAKTDTKISVSLLDSIVLMLAIIAEIVVCVRGGLNLAVPLFLTWLIMFLYCKIRRISWSVVENFALQGVRDGFQSVCIVAAVGCLIGTWILGGTVPQVGGGSQANSAQSDYNSQYSEQDKQKDKFLCTDALSTEKHVSSLYNTCIFECKDTNVRNVLNHIQKEEQQHGEKIYNFMSQNGMYS